MTSTFVNNFDLCVSDLDLCVSDLNLSVIEFDLCVNDFDLCASNLDLSVTSTSVSMTSTSVSMSVIVFHGLRSISGFALSLYTVFLQLFPPRLSTSSGFKSLFMTLVKYCTLKVSMFGWWSF